MKIEIHSIRSLKRRAHKPFTPDTALISIGDFGTGLPLLEYKPAHILRLEFDDVTLRFLYKGIIINHNKKPSQPTLKRRFFKKKAAFFHGPVWERSGADFILKRKGEFF